jgi:hypothetical protein
MTLTKDGLSRKDIPYVQISLLLKEWKETGKKPFLNGWEFYKDSSKPATLSAHYKDGPALDKEYFVPTVYLWGSKTLQTGGFTRYPKGHCGYCGTELELGDNWECPNCGGT